MLAQTFDRIFDNFRRRPQRFAFADIDHETLQHAQTLASMRDFRMELHAVKTLLFVSHNGERTGFGAGDGNEVGRDRGHFIAVAHPDVEQRFACGADGVFDVADQRARRQHFHLRITELALVRTFDFAAQLHRHGLHAVADAEHRYARIEDILWRAGAVEFGGAFRAAGKDDAVRVELADLLFGDIPCPEFAVHAQLAYAARDQLRVLRTKIENQNAMLMNIFRRH